MEHEVLQEDHPEGRYPRGPSSPILVPGGIGTVDISAIVIATVNAATRGITEAMAAHTSGVVIIMLMALIVITMG